VEAICQEKSGKPPGSKPFFAVYQKVLTEFITKLSQEEQDKYEKMAHEWTNRSPPEEVQRKWVYVPMHHV
jgi:hypothetical protein